MALGINRTLYWLRVLITWGLELSWSIALVSELHIFLVDILIVCEIVALIILVLLIRYLFGCCCLARRFALLLCGFGCALDDFDSLWMYRNWTKCEIRRVLTDLESFYCGDGILAWLRLYRWLEMIRDEMIVLVVIEWVFSIVLIRKCCRTSVMVHGTSHSLPTTLTQLISVENVRCMR